MVHLAPFRFKIPSRHYNSLNNAAHADTPSASQTDIALRESEAFYRQMFESNRAVKMVIDPATAQIVKVNQAACDFYGYSHEQMTSL